MDDLIVFLRACLDDDERVARAATPGPWESQWWGVRTAYEFDCPGYINHGERVSVAHNSATVGNREAEIRNVEHIARWDPERVLADIDSKRRIIDRWAELHHEVCDALDRDEPDAAPDVTEFAYEQVCHLLALPYADRPGYREEWRSVG